MGKDKGKKMKIEEQNPDKEEEEQVIEVEVDAEVLLSLKKLQDLQDELDKVNEEAEEKVAEIEQKYSEIRKPVYAKRQEFIEGIPDFWTISFASHPFIFDRLTPEDQKVFKYLSSIEVEDSEVVSSGYTITFNFKPNPYFENSKLSKSFSSPEDELTVSVTGTTINWKEGMDLTTEAKNEKKGSKKRPFVDDRSFFCWFNDTVLTDDAEEFSDEVAEIIVEELWPNPLQYYNYEPEEATDNDLELDDDDNKDGEEQDEDDDDEDDDGDSE